MAGKLNLTFADFGGEKSTFSVFINPVNAANFDANDVLVTNLVNAILGVTEGIIVKDTRNYADVGNGQGASTIPTAQRENKWLITYEDTTTFKRYQRELPCPTLSAATILPDIGGNANLADALWVTFIAAFEAAAVSEDGNGVNFISARHVGRNN